MLTDRGRPPACPRRRRQHGLRPEHPHFRESGGVPRRQGGRGRAGPRGAAAARPAEPPSAPDHRHSRVPRRRPRGAQASRPQQHQQQQQQQQHSKGHWAGGRQLSRRAGQGALRAAVPRAWLGVTLTDARGESCGTTRAGGRTAVPGPRSVELWLRRCPRRRARSPNTPDVWSRRALRT